MSKQEFLNELKKKLPKLTKKEAFEQLNFYSEMIDDMMEEGLPESEAVARIGRVDEIASQILLDRVPLKNEPTSMKKYSALEIVLLVLGSPVWAALLISAFAVVFSLYAALWSLVVSLWAVFVSVAACAPIGVVGGIVHTFGELRITGFALIGIGVFCAGLAIFLFVACKSATCCTVRLSVATGRGIKNCFGKKREA